MEKGNLIWYNVRFAVWLKSNLRHTAPFYFDCRVKVWFFFSVGSVIFANKKFLVASNNGYYFSVLKTRILRWVYLRCKNYPERAKIRSSRKLPDIRYLELNMFNFKIVLLIYALSILYVRPILLTVCNQLIEITTTSVVCDVYIQFWKSLQFTGYN